MSEKERLQAQLLDILKRLVKISEEERQSTLAPRSEVEEAIEKLDWKSTDYGDWTFRFKEKGSRDQTPEQRTLSDAIEAAGGKLVVGKLEYTLPQGKPFISRRERK